VSQILSSVNIKALIESLINSTILVIILLACYKYFKSFKDTDKELEKLNTCRKISNRMNEIVKEKLADSKYYNDKYLDYLMYRYMYKVWSINKYVKDKRTIDFKNPDLYIEKYFEYFWTKNRFHTNKFTISYKKKDIFLKTIKNIVKDSVSEKIKTENNLTEEGNKD
jgi:hypothetical protein